MDMFKLFWNTTKDFEVTADYNGNHEYPDMLIYSIRKEPVLKKMYSVSLDSFPKRFVLRYHMKRKNIEYDIPVRYREENDKVDPPIEFDKDNVDLDIEMNYECKSYKWADGITHNEYNNMMYMWNDHIDGVTKFHYYMRILYEYMRRNGSDTVRRRLTNHHSRCAGMLYSAPKEFKKMDWHNKFDALKMYIELYNYDEL